MFISKATDKILAICGLSAGLILADQATKWLAVKYFKTPIALIENWISFEFHLNKGIAFSLPVSGNIVAYLTPLLLFGFIWFFYKNLDLSKLRTVFLVSLIFSGALGNFIDRIAYKGAVVDFIAIGWYPVFNLADVYLTVGVLGLIFVTIADKKSGL